jgi:hypothetical protein
VGDGEEMLQVIGCHPQIEVEDTTWHGIDSVRYAVARNSGSWNLKPRQSNLFQGTSPRSLPAYDSGGSTPICASVH